MRDFVGLRLVCRNPWRIGDEQGLSVAAFDTLDQVGLNLVAAVGEGAPAAGDFQRSEVGGTECQGQVARQVVLVEAEAADIIQRIVDADGLQQTDRHQVARLVQGFTQADRAKEGVVIVLRAPGLFHAGFMENDGGVIHQTGGGEAVVQGGGVKEGLEAGPRLSLGLGRSVVVALLE
ncbi:hypothetical protein D9M71_324890 [compost metagenome]